VVNPKTLQTPNPKEGFPEMSEARVEDTEQDANGDFCVVSGKPKIEVGGTPVFDDDGQQVGIRPDKPIILPGRDNGSDPIIPTKPLLRLTIPSYSRTSLSSCAAMSY
jgi:hypothetical protein